MPSRKTKRQPLADEQQVHRRGQQHAERPAGLDDRIEHAAMARGNLLVDDRDRDHELGLGEGRGQHAHQHELPKRLDEVGEAGEQRGGAQAQHPHAAAADDVERVADDQGDHQLGRGDEEDQRADEARRQSELAGDVGDRQDQEVVVVGREREPGERDADQIDRVAPDLGSAHRDMHRVRLLSRPDLLLWQLIQTVLGCRRRTMTPEGDQGKLGHRSERCQGVIGFVFQKNRASRTGITEADGLVRCSPSTSPCSSGALLQQGPIARVGVRGCRLEQ